MNGLDIEQFVPAAAANDGARRATAWPEAMRTTRAQRLRCAAAHGLSASIRDGASRLGLRAVADPFAAGRFAAMVDHERGELLYNPNREHDARVALAGEALSREGVRFGWCDAQALALEMRLMLLAGGAS